MNSAILEGVGWDSSVIIKTEGRYPLRLLGFDIDIEAKLHKLMYFWKTLFLISLSLTQIEQILHQRLKTHEDSHQSLSTRTHQPLDLAAILNPDVIGSTWRPYDFWLLMTLCGERILWGRARWLDCFHSPESISFGHKWGSEDHCDLGSLKDYYFVPEYAVMKLQELFWDKESVQWPFHSTVRL